MARERHIITCPLCECMCGSQVDVEDDEVVLIHGVVQRHGIEACTTFIGNPGFHHIYSAGPVNRQAGPRFASLPLAAVGR